MINNHNTPLKGSLVKIFDNNLHGEWKIQVTMQINFASSLEPAEIGTMDSKSKKYRTFDG